MSPAAGLVTPAHRLARPCAALLLTLAGGGGAAMHAVEALRMRDAAGRNAAHVAVEVGWARGVKVVASLMRHWESRGRSG